MVMLHCIHKLVAAVDIHPEDNLHLEELDIQAAIAAVAHRPADLAEGTVGTLAGRPGTAVGPLGLADLDTRTRGQ